MMWMCEMSESVETICNDIHNEHRRRIFAMEQRKRANLALGAFLRTQLGWDPDLPKEEASRIRKTAVDMMEGKVDAGEWTEMIVASNLARAPWDKIENDTTKLITKLAKQLPVWESFGEQVNGFGALGLGIIVGEAGNLSDYPKKGHLWKRMGVAVLDGVAQGKLKGNASAETWIRHGYNPARRSRLYTIGDSLIKKQGPYRDVYLQRKEYERTRAEMSGLQVLPAAKITAKIKAECMSEGHVHARSQRYMEKRLLRDLLGAWKAAA